MGLVVIVDVERGTNAHSCVNFKRGAFFLHLLPADDEKKHKTHINP